MLFMQQRADINNGDRNDNKMTYEEILGPDSSLNDILNFDFAGRYQNKYKRLEQ